MKTSSSAFSVFSITHFTEFLRSELELFFFLRYFDCHIIIIWLIYGLEPKTTKIYEQFQSMACVSKVVLYVSIDGKSYNYESSMGQLFKIYCLCI